MKLFIGLAALVLAESCYAVDPKVVVVTGQSNALQIFQSRVAMTANPLVKDWVEISEDVYGFVDFDPNGPQKPITSAILVGHIRGGKGGVAWGLANRTAILKNQLVYMICVAEGAKTIAGWKPNVGSTGVALDTHVSDALSAIQVEYPSVQSVNVLMWVQGESDIVAFEIGEGYRDKFFEWRDQLTWIDSNTRIFLTEISREFDGSADWEGHNLIIQQDPSIKLLSSEGKETIDTAHFWGDEATEFGNEAALMTVVGC